MGECNRDPIAKRADRRRSAAFPGAAWRQSADAEKAQRLSSGSFWPASAIPIIKILLVALAINVIFLFRHFDWFEIGRHCHRHFSGHLCLHPVGIRQRIRLHTSCRRTRRRIQCRVKRAEGVRCPAHRRTWWWGTWCCSRRANAIPADGVLLSGRLQRGSVRPQRRKPRRRKRSPAGRTVRT